jgi:gamma-glutamyltranspeptidase / glutathione hydrolase
MGHELSRIRPTPRTRRRFAWSCALALALGCRSTPARLPPPDAAHAAMVSRAPSDTPLAAAGIVSAEVAKLGAVASGRHGAVSSAESNASFVGRAVLERGGNAVDAAIAVAFALGVTQPSAGNIGGGGFMLVRRPNGEAVAIDYREVAPGAAHRDMFLDGAGEVTLDGRYGPRAAGIPGTVAGLALAHEKFGTLPWAELVAPAIALARAGHRLDAEHAQELAWGLDTLRQYQKRIDSATPSATRTALEQAVQATGVLWSRADGSALLVGDLWQQPELADTLELIAHGGAAAFYAGPLADRLATGVQAMGGLWTVEDLAGYRVIERAPLELDYHGHHVLTMPPPSGGGVVLRQILAASEQLGLAALDWDSPERVHLFAEVARRAYAARNELIGDPDFMHVPLERLLDTRHMLARMADIDRHHATPSSQIATGIPLAESMHTTHFSVIDRSGMAVANTFTLNESFGARVQAPGTGVTLNNEMDDFTAKVGAPNLFGLVQGTQNAIEPGKRMLSSMSPTIVLRGERVRAVLGSPGGPTITTTVAQILMQLIDHGRSLESAIAAPRVHHQWLPDQLMIERRLPDATARALTALGHTLSPELGIGHANCIEVELPAGMIHAVADVTRGGGAAAAY